MRQLDLGELQRVGQVPDLVLVIITWRVWKLWGWIDNVPIISVNLTRWYGAVALMPVENAVIPEPAGIFG